MRGAVSVSVVLTATLVACGRDTDSIAAKIDSYLAAVTRLGRFSGAVLVVRDGRDVLRRGYGFADLDSHTPFAPETQMPVASISKMFTAMTVLRLRDEGKLALEDSVCRYVEDCPPAWEPITLEHLMRHTSGIPDYEERLEIGSQAYFEMMSRPDANREIVADARTRPLSFAPGSQFHYSNTGYVLLGFIVQKVADAPFADAIQKYVFTPAGMGATGAFGGTRRAERLAIGYTYESIPWEKFLPGVPLDSGVLHRVPTLPLSSPAGDAGVFSAVDDLARWSAVMDGGDFVSPQLAHEVFTAGLEGYGYGWVVDSLFDQRRQHHNGILPGSLSELIRFPNQHLTIVILCNQDRARLSTIARDLSAIALGKPYDMPVEGPVASLTAADFDALVGEYTADDGTRYSVRKDPDMLLVERKGRFTAGLIPLSPVHFYLPLANGVAEFTLGADSHAVEVNLRFGGEDHRARRDARPAGK